ncbi:glucosyltransferase domain-containing protein [Pantoea sp. SOD02]|uniref:glucosyltransferase domain-containing protein n=1 Tax=Pantoea sp. SOD02 TaxID=2970818 RepID=UPI0021577B9B|nr:glucosyltransferase domain-containing protein [Pantoea sp. SOD02]UVC31937.1 glucosyltransferase domain-containing protein [Pantoea sp. SOD02]
MMPVNDPPSASRMQRIALTMMVAMLATLPVWTHKIYYRDDLYRILDGDRSVWMSNGRPGTWLLEALVSFGNTVSDVSPLNLLLGLLVLSVAAVFFTEKLKIPLIGYWSFVPPLFVVLNPFLAQGMLYTFDSLTILLSFAGAMLASMVNRSKPFQEVIYTALILLLIQTLYQPGLNVYIACVALLAISRLNNDQSTWTWLAGKIVALGIAILVYKLAMNYLLPVKIDWYSMKHSKLLLPNSESLPVIIETIKTFSRLFLSAYPRGLMILLLLPLLMLFSGLILMARNLKQQRKLTVSAAILMLSAGLIVIIAIPGLSLALATPLFAPRMLGACSITFLFCFYVSVLALPAIKNWLAGFSIIFLFYHLVVMSITFNTVVNDQRYQMDVMNQIKISLSAPGAQSIDSLAFVGQLNDAPEVQTNIRNFPIIDHIRMKMLGESEPWIWLALIKNAGLRLKAVNATEEMRVIKPREYLSQGPDFDAFQDGQTMVIDFRKSGGQVNK